MIDIKKSNCFIALLIVVFAFNAFSMKRAHEEKTWVETVGEILLDEANIQDLVGFTNMPPEVLERIIYLLSANVAAQSLEDVARNINNLVLVNKQLNELINHPSFCLHLIKHLSQKFNCSNEEAAKALHTKEAQRRLKLQDELYEVCVTDIAPDIQNLEKCLLKGAEINFTYQKYGSLLMEVYCNQFDDCYVDIIRWLVKHGANQDQQNILLIRIIENYYGTGAIYEDQLEVIKILLDAKANPEITDNKGNSILLLAQKALDEWQQYYDNEYNKYEPDDLSEDLEGINRITTVIKMLEDAIQRKHARK